MSFQLPLPPGSTLNLFTPTELSILSYFHTHLTPTQTASPQILSLLVLPRLPGRDVEEVLAMLARMHSRRQQREMVRQREMERIDLLESTSSTSEVGSSISGAESGSRGVRRSREALNDGNQDNLHQSHEDDPNPSPRTRLRASRERIAAAPPPPSLAPAGVDPTRAYSQALTAAQRNPTSSSSVGRGRNVSGDTVRSDESNETVNGNNHQRQRAHHVMILRRRNSNETIASVTSSFVEHAEERGYTITRGRAMPVIGADETEEDVEATETRPRTRQTLVVTTSGRGRGRNGRRGARGGRNRGGRTGAAAAAAVGRRTLTVPEPTIERVRSSSEPLELASAGPSPDVATEPSVAASTAASLVPPPPLTRHTSSATILVNRISPVSESTSQSAAGPSASRAGALPPRRARQGLQLGNRPNTVMSHLPPHVFHGPSTSGSIFSASAPSAPVPAPATTAVTERATSPVVHASSSTTLEDAEPMTLRNRRLPGPTPPPAPIQPTPRTNVATRARDMIFGQWARRPTSTSNVAPTQAAPAPVVPVAVSVAPAPTRTRIQPLALSESLVNAIPTAPFNVAGGHNIFAWATNVERLPPESQEAPLLPPPRRVMSPAQSSSDGDLPLDPPSQIPPSFTDATTTRHAAPTTAANLAAARAAGQAGLGQGHPSPQSSLNAMRTRAAAPSGRRLGSGGSPPGNRGRNMGNLLRNAPRR